MSFDGFKVLLNTGAMVTIRTQNICPPVPTRAWDWEAWIDGEEERGSEYGRTEGAAMAALIERLADEERT